MNLHKKKWTTGLKVDSYVQLDESNASLCEQMLKTAVLYNKAIIEEREQTKEQREIAHVGKTDPKKKISSDVEEMMGNNIIQSLGTMLDAVVFSAE